MIKEKKRNNFQKQNKKNQGVFSLHLDKGG